MKLSKYLSFSKIEHPKTGSLIKLTVKPDANGELPIQEAKDFDGYELFITEKTFRKLAERGIEKLENK